MRYSALLSPQPHLAQGGQNPGQGSKGAHGREISQKVLYPIRANGILSGCLKLLLVIIREGYFGGCGEIYGEKQAAACWK